MNRFLFVTFSFLFISIANCQTVDFTFESTSGVFCSPSKVIFKQKCTGNPQSFIWSFGNNLYSDRPIDSTFYAAAGTYTVKLIAVYEKTGIEISKTIVIHPAITVGIGYDRNYICQPGVINFTGLGSANVKNYEWNFGDGTAIVNTASNTIGHSFANFGTNIVFLKATSNAGCTDTTSTVVSVNKFAIKGTVTPFRGCSPADVSFTGEVGTLPVNSSVKSYTWDFDDGSPQYTSFTNLATHTYTNSGDYFPKLTVITDEGCTSTYSYGMLYFGAPPTNQIVYAKMNPICGSDSAVFISKATNADRYFWDFGEGYSVATTDTIIKHKFNTVGIKKVLVAPAFKNCPAPVKSYIISIIGVIAKFDYANTCSNKNTYLFSDTSSGIATSRLWTFGDAFQQPSLVNTIHSYPTSGQFTTTLFLADTVTGCRDSISRQIYTATPDLYSADSTLCINTKGSFSILNNYTDTAALYSWNVLGTQIDTIRNSAINIVADSLGRFKNFVVINYGKQSCPDTVSLNNLILVRGPNLDFTAPSGICLNTTLQATNYSKPYMAEDSINIWKWNFGNSATNYVLFQPAPYQYTREGDYKVSLIALDKNGCSDTLTKTITINPTPYLHILPKTASLCYGKSITMNAYHNNDVIWSPSNSLSCTTCDTTIATPLVSTRYYITASNSFNCSVQDSNFIKVELPFTATIAPTDIYICQNLTTTVDVNPKGKKIVWSPATGLSNATIYKPVITAKQNIIYTATLTDSLGCLFSGSVAVNLHVNPLPLVDAGPDAFYSKGTSFSFTPTYSNNIIAYLWTPSDFLNCNSCPKPVGVVDNFQKYLVKVTSDSGCVASDSVIIGIDCKTANILMPTAFTPNNDNLNDLFYPIARGVKSIIKFTIYNREGQVIFEKGNFSPNDRSYGWDGRFKGAIQSMGTYVYTIEAICYLGEKLYKNGSVVLVR